MSSMKSLVDMYYSQHELEALDAEYAIVDLVRAMGELADAYLEKHEDEMHNGPKMLLRVLAADGAKANALLRGGKAVGKCEQRNKEVVIGYEIGHVLMRLERFSQAAGCGEPLHCLVRLMQNKGGHKK